MTARGARRRWIAVVASAAVIVGVAGVVPPADAALAPAAAPTVRPVAPAATPATPPARRVLLLVVPGLAWRDFRDRDLPNLRRFTSRAAIANMSTRAPKLRSDLTSGYVTLGAGNKAVGVGPAADGSGLEPDGAAFGVDEALGPDRAGPVFTRRTGRSSAEGLVHLGISETVAANRDSVFGARVGALGDTLKAGGYGRAVIANGDGSDVAQPGEDTTRHRRDAVAALMTGDGTVPAGDVSDDLLLADPAAPFGVRLDRDRVQLAFTQQWRDRSVVLVEASDLVRAAAYQAVTTPKRGLAVRREALQRADDLAGRLFAQVDPNRDAVVLLGTAPDPGVAALAVAAVRAPGMPAGLLRSGTTQRAGFVQLMDIAPSVLGLVGLKPADSMRGRPIEVSERHGSAKSRRAFLVDADAAARFRAQIVDKVAAAFIGLECGLIAVAVCSSTGVARRVTDVVLPALASGALAFIPAVYLARLLPLYDWGLAAYWGFLFLATLGLAAAARLAARRRPLDAAIIGLGVIVAVLVGDGVTGSRLQLNSALGFSPEVAGRFIGYGNAGYAALTAAALLLAGLLAHRLGAGRLGARRGAWVGVGVLGVALIVDGAPFWGADVGGVLSLVPAFGVTAALLLGWRLRVRARNVLIFGSVTVLAIALAAFADMQRAAANRTHLGRLVEQVHGEGFSAFSSVVRRKLDMNISSLSTSIWRILVPIALAFIAYLAFAGSRPLLELMRRVPALASTLIGFAILLVLGYALNDTGILVPAVMLGVLVPVLVLLIHPLDRPPPTPALAPVATVSGSVDAPDA